MTSFNFYYNAQPSPAGTSVSTPCTLKGGEGPELSEQLRGSPHTDRTMKGKRKLEFLTESSTPGTPPQPPQSRRKIPGNCFNCKQPGHWRDDCPSWKFKFDSTVTVTSTPEFPVYHCPCGHGACTIVFKEANSTSYYICPINRGRKCGFPKPCKVVIQKGLHSIPPAYKYPQCACGAGVCRKEKCLGGPAAGRNCFFCPIKKGHGACSFSLFEDDFNLSRSIDWEEATESPSVQSFLDDEIYFDLLDEDWEMALDPQAVVTHQPMARMLGTPQKSQEGEIAVMSIPGENSVSQPNNAVIEELDDRVIPVGMAWGTILTQPLKHARRQSSSIELHHWQREFLRQWSGLGFDLLEKFPLNGWLGRLLYGPSPCLARILHGPCIYDLESNSFEGARFTTAGFSETSYIRHCQSQFAESRLPSISEPKLLAAQHVQNQLQQSALMANLLCPENMKTLATSKIDSQQHLCVYYGTLSTHAVDYNHCPSSSMEIEESSPHHSLSSGELHDKRDNGNLKFDHLCSEHVEAVTSVRVSEQRIKLLEDEASLIKSLLHDIETWDWDNIV